MKNIILTSIAFIATLTLLTSCSGNKYIGEYKALTNSIVQKLDSVTTVEQYNNIVTDYTASAEELRAKYSQENFSDQEVNDIKEITAKIAAKFYDIQAKLPLSHPEVIEEITQEQITTN